MEPSSVIGESLDVASSQSAQAASQVAQARVEANSDWLGRTISTWPDWLSTPTFAVLQSLNFDVQAPDARERNEIRQNIIDDLGKIILEYRVPADLEEAVRNEILNRADTFGAPLSASLVGLFTEHAFFIPLVSTLDLHGIDLVPEVMKNSMLMHIGDCSKELRAIALHLPHLKQLNLSNCSIGNLPARVIPTITDKTLFPEVEVLDLSQNNLVFTMQNGPLDITNSVRIADLMELPKLKTLIVKQNRISQADKAAAQVHYPHLDIIDG